MRMRRRVKAVFDWRSGSARQPLELKRVRSIGHGPSVSTQLLHFREFTVVQNSVELNRPGPAVKSLPPRLVTEEFHLGEHVHPAEVCSTDFDGFVASVLMLSHLGGQQRYEEILRVHV